RLKLHGLAVGGDRLVQLALLVQGQAEVVVGPGAVRPQGDGCRREANRIGPLVLVFALQELLAQFVINPEVTGVALPAAPQAADRGLVRPGRAWGPSPEHQGYRRPPGVIPSPGQLPRPRPAPAGTGPAYPRAPVIRVGRGHDLMHPVPFLGLLPFRQRRPVV